MTINPLKHCGCYTSHILKHFFRMILTINAYYVPTQHQLVCFCCTDRLHFLSLKTEILKAKIKLISSCTFLIPLHEQPRVIGLPPNRDLQQCSDLSHFHFSKYTTKCPWQTKDLLCCGKVRQADVLYAMMKCLAKWQLNILLQSALCFYVIQP